jgi:hypothetical protein
LNVRETHKINPNTPNWNSEEKAPISTMLFSFVRLNTLFIVPVDDIEPRPKP